MFGLLATIFAWGAYGVANGMQHTKEKQRTRDWREYSEENNLLTYYDYRHNCDRYTKTGEKCKVCCDWDEDGETYRYVMTDYLGQKFLKGFEYLPNSRKRGEKVKISRDSMKKWAKKGYYIDEYYR